MDTTIKEQQGQAQDLKVLIDRVDLPIQTTNREGGSKLKPYFKPIILAVSIISIMIIALNYFLVLAPVSHVAEEIPVNSSWLNVSSKFSTGTFIDSSSASILFTVNRSTTNVQLHTPSDEPAPYAPGFWRSLSSVIFSDAYGDFSIFPFLIPTPSLFSF
jgi:hypothetical protein